MVLSAAMDPRRDDDILLLEGGSAKDRKGEMEDWAEEKWKIEGEKEAEAILERTTSIVVRVASRVSVGETIRS